MTRRMSLLLALAVASACAATPETAPREIAAGAREDAAPPELAAVTMWVVGDPAAVELSPPPDDAATARELDELRSLLSARDDARRDRAAWWATGDPAYRWNEIALDAAMRHEKWDDGSRVTSNLNVAVSDALVAAWHWKERYARRRPATRDASLATALPTPESPSYPDEHATAAGAASIVLAYLFPDEAPAFAARAEEAARSRVDAGVAYRSDVAAGLDLGRRVGALVVERAKRDNSDAAWQGQVPTEAGLWNGTDPDLPSMGTWKTWALTSGAELRPPPPPRFDEAAIAEVRDFEQTTATTSAAITWASRPAMEIWQDEASRLVLEYGLDRQPLRAARAYALLHTAFYDATVAAWDAKYAYWGARPDQLDPRVEPLLPTPNFPGYPSAHATQSAASAEVLAALFPRDAEALRAMAREAADSRLWLGIHFRADNEVGLELGRAVAARVLERY